jgi:hypothetical protein
VDNPVLQIRQAAWDKLVHLLSKPTEVGFMGVAYDVGHPLVIDELVMVKQEATAGQTEFDDDALVAFWKNQQQLGRQPIQFGRVWVHTHPRGVDGPSSHDEQTFKRIFGTYNWAIMLIITKEAKYFCRLRVTAPGVAIDKDIPVEILTEQKDTTEWDAEYDLAVQEPLVRTGYVIGSNGNDNRYGYGYGCGYDWREEAWGKDWRERDRKEDTERGLHVKTKHGSTEKDLEEWADELLKWSDDLDLREQALDERDGKPEKDGNVRKPEGEGRGDVEKDMDEAFRLAQEVFQG